MESTTDLAGICALDNLITGDSFTTKGKVVRSKERQFVDLQSQRSVFLEKHLTMVRDRVWSRIASMSLVDHHFLYSFVLQAQRNPQAMKDWAVTMEMVPVDLAGELDWSGLTREYLAWLDENLPHLTMSSVE